MSKTWKKYDGWRDGGKAGKRAANQTVRRHCHEVLNDLPDGSSYKKLYPQWDICDWNCTRSLAEQSYHYHHPHLNVYCICDRSYRSTRSVDCEPPEPVFVDRQWILPSGYHFSRRYGWPMQRVNPETGAYECQLRFRRWVWRHEVEYEYCELQTTRHEHCRYKDMDWHVEEYEQWVPDESPRVCKIVETPFFTAEDVRRHVEYREEDTRNYRYRQRWPRYHRRDRKRARRLKGV